MKKIFQFAMLLSLGFSSLNAATSVWNGTNGQYADSSNWNPTGVPDLGSANTAIINAGAVTQEDNLLVGRGTLQINGGSLTVPNFLSRITVGGTGGTGTLIVSGGTLNAATANQIRIGDDFTTGTFKLTSGSLIAPYTDIGSGGAMNISGGTASFVNTNNGGSFSMTGGTAAQSAYFDMYAGSNFNLSGNASYIYSSNYDFTIYSYINSFSISGSASFSMTGTGQFQPDKAGQSMSGGSLNINGLWAFQSSQKFTLSGGVITIGASASNGISSPGGYINFPPDSWGSILLTNVAAGESNIFDGKIRINDVVYNVGNYLSVFKVTHPTPTSTLIQPIPEPNAYAAAMGLGCAGLCLLRRRRKRSSAQVA